MRRLLTASSLSLLATACAAPQVEPTPAPEPAPVAEPGESDDDRRAREAAEAKAAEDAAKAQEDAALRERIAEAEKQLAEDIEKEEARWTDNLKKRTQKLADRDNKGLEVALKIILRGAHRKPGNKERDKYRHPIETLAFFGVKPTDTVFEYAPGGMWYSEILAPLLARKGELVMQTTDPASSDPRLAYNAKALGERLSLSDELWGKVQLVMNEDPNQEPSFGDPESADVVLIIRMLHNVHRRDLWDPVMKEAFDVLRPRGTLGIVQHRALEGANPDESADKGRLDENWVIEKIESYGFELVAASDINNNSKDTKDYEKGVWTLPPVLTLGDEDRDEYLKIGESDRMTLKFRKPKARAKTEPEGGQDKGKDKAE